MLSQSFVEMPRDSKVPWREVEKKAQKKARRKTDTRRRKPRSSG